MEMLATIAQRTELPVSLPRERKQGDRLEGRESTLPNDSGETQMLSPRAVIALGVPMIYWI